jgi:uncharacterized delta-60 repeat protein
VNGLLRKSIARLNADGSPDSFFADVDTTVIGCLPQPDGKVLIWGFFEFVNGVSHPGFARLNVDGSLDPTFVGGRDPEGTYMAKAVALQPDGKLLVAREVLNGGGHPCFVRLTANGSWDNSFFAGQSGPDNVVDSLAVQPDGKVLLGGEFSVVNQTPCAGVVRLMGLYAPLAILANPSSQTAEVGSSVTFSVSASGYAPVFQWFFNSEVINNGTNVKLPLPSIQPLDSGIYTVVVTNITGAVTSAPAVLAVIPSIEKRVVPALSLVGESGSSLHLENSTELGPTANWLPLDTVTLKNSPQWYFDLSSPLPSQSYYRAWQAAPASPPGLDLHFVRAITLTGTIGDAILVDAINQFGPTNAWFTLATVMLTNSSQFYFDTSAIGKPTRLYRLLQVP